MNLRYLKKSDGTKVLQQLFYPEIGTKDLTAHWCDIPTIEEPQQTKELWEVLNDIVRTERGNIYYIDGCKKLAQAAREYIERERKAE